MSEVYLNLDNYVKDAIINCVDGNMDAIPSCFEIDKYLAAGPNNIEFLPCKMVGKDLIVSFKKSNENMIYSKTFNVSEIVQTAVGA